MCLELLHPTSVALTFPCIPRTRTLGDPAHGWIGVGEALEKKTRLPTLVRVPDDANARDRNLEGVSLHTSDDSGQGVERGDLRRRPVLRHGIEQ